jgi:uncharacterized protein (TIGR02001 family)
MADGRTFKTLAAMTIAAGMVSVATAEHHEGVNNGKVGVQASVDVVTEYWFRGIYQENTGIITQPSLNVSFQITDNLSAWAGVWNSFHDSEASDDTFYETDWYAGVSYSMDKWGFDLGYTSYYGPSAASEFAQEIALTASYDDSDAWGLSPYAMIAYELSDGADGNLAGGSEGIYLELGISKSWIVSDSTDNPITLEVPVTVGLSLDDYYELEETAGIPDGGDDTLGFVDLGLILSMPLNMPADYGSWSVSAGVHFLFLNEDTTGTHANNNGGDDELNIYGTFGIGFEY